MQQVLVSSSKCTDELEVTHFKQWSSVCLYILSDEQYTLSTTLLHQATGVEDWNAGISQVLPKPMQENCICPAGRMSVLDTTPTKISLLTAGNIQSIHSIVLVGFAGGASYALILHHPSLNPGSQYVDQNAMNLAQILVFDCDSL